MSAFVQEIVKDLKLEPHPEGGFYREMFRDEGKIPKSALPGRFKGDRNYSTAIYYLLPQGTFSSLHRIPSDEVWHFYSGQSMTVVEITPDGRVIKTVLGQNLAQGEKLQSVVKAGNWFGAYPNAGTEYALVGCTVAPGFDFADFEKGDRTQLLKEFPQAREVIERLTRIA